MKRGRLIVATLVGALAACVTVNVYFPAAQVERTAEKIVGDVYREGTPAPEPAPEAKPRSLSTGGAPRWVLAGLGPAAAHAEEATSVSNAAIRALKDQIAARHRELLASYRQGVVGIDRKGYLEVVGGKGLALPELAAARRLVDADNADRRRLYAEVAKALGLKPEQVADVEKIFAREWRDKAQAGWPVQGDDGRWGPK